MTVATPTKPTTIFGSVFPASFLPSLKTAGSKPAFSTLQKEGNLLFKKNRYNEAISKYKDCLIALKYGRRKEKGELSKEEVDNVIVPVLCKLGQCNLELRQYSKTLFYCQQALELKPKDRKAMYLQSVASLETGQYSSAMKFYER
jgi:tetratricopeptide (TPR) repeat protein